MNGQRDLVCGQCECVDTTAGREHSQGWTELSLLLLGLIFPVGDGFPDLQVEDAHSWFQPSQKEKQAETGCSERTSSKKVISVS